jgi:iron complex outermembrane receptor protein
VINKVGLLLSAFLMSVVNAALMFSIPTAVRAQALEEIVVTARKTEESLQEVPISISAFSSQQMQDRGIRDNYDVARFTPNFTTVQRVGRDLDRPIIRGMSNPGSRGEPNASYFIDGTFVARTISTATTQSMERVEVLRGPQSAQFGRATFSGAVNYVTRKPTNEFEGALNVRAGTYEDSMLGGWISGPIIEDKLLFLVSAAHEHYGGQWNNNLQPNSAFVNGNLGASIFDGQNTEGDYTPLGEIETRDLLTKVTWMPGDATEFNLKWSLTKTDDGQYPVNIFDTLNCQLPNDPTQAWFETSGGAYCGDYSTEGTENRKNLPDLRNGLYVQDPILGAPTLPPDQRVSDPVEPGLRRETNRYLGEYVQDIYGWDSVLALSHSTDYFDSAYDLDHQEVRAVWGLFAFNNVFDTTDYSVEYSISSPVDKPIRGKLGVYVYKQELVDMQRSVTGPLAAFDIAPGTDFQDPRTQNIDNSSVFGGVAFDLSDQWTLNLEARLAEDEKDITSGQRNLMNESAPVMDELSFTSFTPRITMEYQWTDDLMLYFQGANGTKPGGFNTEYFRSDIPAEYTEYLLNCDPANPGTPPVIPGFDVTCDQQTKDQLTFSEEEQWTYEVGFKSTWWDRRILLNVSAFYIDWTNQGLFSTIELPNTSGTINTTSILINAGKSEIYGMEIESNYAVTDNLTLIANYGYNHGRFKEGTDPDFAALSGGDGDITGHTLPDSPAHSVVLGFDARAQVSASLTGFLRGDFLYDSDKFVRAANYGKIGDRNLVNFRTGIDADSWTLTLYIRNLLNEDTPLSLFSFVDFAAEKKGLQGTGQYDFVDVVAPFDGTIDTVADAPNNNDYPNLGGLNPQPGRDMGLEFQFRF